MEGAPPISSFHQQSLKFNQKVDWNWWFVEMKLKIDWWIDLWVEWTFVEWKQRRQWNQVIDAMNFCCAMKQKEWNGAPSSNSCAASSSTKSSISFSRCARRNADCCWMGRERAIPLRSSIINHIQLHSN